MTRIIEVEFETSAVKVETALNRFFVKYPELKYWRETFEWMEENNKDFECNNLFGDGTRNTEWTYALHLDINEHIMDNSKDFYICVIERA